MLPNDPEIDPLEALQVLRKISGEFSRLADQQFDGIDQELKDLVSAIESLGARPARPPVCPEDYIRQWQEYCRGARKELGLRAARYLCWEPSVATDERFQMYLERSARPLSARTLQGLVRACHIAWSRQFSRGPVAAQIRQRIRRYDGPNQIIERWRSHLDMILGPSGEKMLAERVVEEQKGVTATCENWKVDENTVFVRDAVKQALMQSLAAQNLDSHLQEFVIRHLLGWSKWTDSDFRQQAAEVILAVEGGNALSERLKQLITDDSRLGDPRLPRSSPNWLGLDGAKARFTEWLSREDIVFFFEHVLPQGKDPHGRKRFWLHYVKSIRRSRPLLCSDDERRLIGIKRSDIPLYPTSAKSKV